MKADRHPGSFIMEKDLNYFSGRGSVDRAPRLEFAGSSGASCCRFCLRIMDPDPGHGEGTFLEVHCLDHLAQEVALQVRAKDRVCVEGRLKTRRRAEGILDCWLLASRVEALGKEDLTCGSGPGEAPQSTPPLRPKGAPVRF
jgi:hypothetical protein